MSRLYLSHFGFSRPPFELTPDGRFFFSGGERGRQLAALAAVAEEMSGIALIVGEVGSGKTMLARLLIERLPRTVHSVYLLNPAFDRDEVLLVIARDLGLPASVYGSVSRAARLMAIEAELLERQTRGERTVLVVDEAHLMPAGTLEEIRLLSNIETARGKALSIMLFAQPEIDCLLVAHHMRQVRDRIIYRFDLDRLPAAQTRDYLDHRSRQAGWAGGALFSAGAVRAIAGASHGWLRSINKLADKSLLAAYAEGSTSVETRHARAACREMAAMVRPRRDFRTLLRRLVAWFSIPVAALTAGGLIAHASSREAAPVAGVQAPGRLPANPVSTSPTPHPAGTPERDRASATSQQK